MEGQYQKNNYVDRICFDIIQQIRKRTWAEGIVSISGIIYVQINIYYGIAANTVL